ncbi:MAG: glycosyltransferase [Lachnospiraceae bacterium]|nr:glycosyltransferase [Lachnospiraceae bacterium]
MKQDILLSVIVPVYNIEDCLERCINSIRQQTWTNLEILLVDDGSSDSSGQICDRMAAEDDRIRVFHKKNGGSSSARNLGISHAKGQWLGFVDSDDWIDPEMYEKLLKAALENDVKIAQASRDEIDEDLQKRPDVCTPPEKQMVCGAEDFLRELLLHRGDCSFCTKLVRRELFEFRRFPEGKLNEDFFLLVDMLGEGSGICILPQQMYHVFYRIGSNTRKKDKNDFSRVFLDIVDNADFVEHLVWKKYPQLKTEAVRFALFQRLDYLLHIPVGRMVNSDPFYCRVKKYLRSHVKDTVTNPFLTKKNKGYLLLLTIAPKTVRRVHGFMMKRRG